MRFLLRSVQTRTLWFLRHYPGSGISVTDPQTNLDRRAAMSRWARQQTKSVTFSCAQGASDNGNGADSSGRLHPAGDSESWLEFVRYDELTLEEREIHDSHLAALARGEEFYLDPVTCYSVMTRLGHVRRGDCCGNSCRHCPFGQSKVPESERKRYNSAFFV